MAATPILAYSSRWDVSYKCEYFRDKHFHSREGMRRIFSDTQTGQYVVSWITLDLPKAAEMMCLGTRAV